MIIYNDNGNPIVASMEIDYKGYTISIDCDPSEYPKLFISLNGEEVGTDPFDMSDVVTNCSLQDAIEWIEEDIKCRKEETEEEIFLNELRQLTGCSKEYCIAAWYTLTDAAKLTPKESANIYAKQFNITKTPE